MKEVQKMEDEKEERNPPSFLSSSLLFLLRLVG